MKYVLALGAITAWTALAVLPASASAVAPGFIETQFTFSLEPGIPTITDVNFFLAGNGNTIRGYTQRDISLAPSATALTEFFNVGSSFMLSGILGYGLIQDVPGDPSTYHVVVLGNFTPAQLGQSWDTLFPDADEDVDRGDIQQHGFPVSLSIDPFFNDALNDGLFSSGNGNLDVVAFSTGQLLGTATITTTAADVPEPVTLSLFGAGLAGTIAACRRNKMKAAQRETN